MSGVKAALKAAKQAIDNEQWTEAESQAQVALAADPRNYFASIFLGRSLDKQDKLDAAAKAYRSATDIKPDDTQAWLGLCSLYERQESKRVDEYAESAVQVAILHANADDLHRCQTVIDKLVLFVKKHGTTSQYKRALQVTLPGSPVYAFLEGRLPHPALTYTRLAELTEKDEKQLINKEIGERRTRLGARVAEVSAQVKRQVYAKSDLEGLYRAIIDWTLDDDVRIEYDDRLLLRAYDNLCVLPKEEKEDKRLQVLQLAEGMVTIKRPCRLAWDIYLEWFEAATPESLDANVLHQYIEFFPTSALAKTLRAFLGSEISPFPVAVKEKTKSTIDDDGADIEQDDDAALSQQDRLLLMSESLGEGQGSPLAHRIVGEYYLHLEEYESAIETTRNGLALLVAEEAKAGISFPDTRDALTSTLATSLVHHQAPRNHAEAERFFRDILGRKPKATAALIGLGLIHEEQEEYSEAIRLLDQALHQDPTNLQIGTEAAWCRSLSGDYSAAFEMLERYLPDIKSDNPRARDLRAQTLYRIGRCMWDMDTSKAARKDRNGAYARFLSSIKTNVNFAPAYTSLGFYYADYARDKKRARQCFQKAFELSASEVDAAERLARAFAEKGEWEIVESIAQRVIESGKVRPPPGSKKKGISWPFSALGVVQMTRLEYSKAVTSFLSALKIKPDDYHSYVGLGESYHNSGRYNSASRTFNYAESPPDGVKMTGGGEKWFTEYMLANVHRELGDFSLAITALNAVLEDRPDEYGVMIALLQTLVEHAWRCIETGSYGEAAENAAEALSLANKIVVLRPAAFNLWKATGDACSIFLWIQGSRDIFDGAAVNNLLATQADETCFASLTEIDGLDLTAVKVEQPVTALTMARLAVLAYKRAIHSCADDIHAQAVAWYNLGWAEYRATKVTDTKAGKKNVKAAVRCFKRAIELEAGNSEFWNSLGVVTSQLSPKVAQHAFVRSLNLNEHSARTWTNLGVLYLLNNDFELAHEAFARAQSTDPDYPLAWIGEGLVAQLLGNEKEAMSHFTHGFEISDASCLVARQRYSVSMFDRLLSDSILSGDTSKLLQPLFALQQIHSQNPEDTAYAHLSALFSERVSDNHTATKHLEAVCAVLENEYETTESQATLIQFAHAKADLARNQLATASHESAVENAQTALDLLADVDDDGADGPSTGNTQVARVRLSAYLCIGLSQHAKSDITSAVDALVSARDLSVSSPDTETGAPESTSDADITCLVARILWRQGATERKIAREQIDGVVAALKPGASSHVDAIVLGAVMALSDNDMTRVQILRRQLEGIVLPATTFTSSTSPPSDTGLTTGGGVSLQKRGDINALLAHIAALVDADGGRAYIQRRILLEPNCADHWAALKSILHRLDDDARRGADDSSRKRNVDVKDIKDIKAYCAAMSLLAAKYAVTNGSIDAGGLAGVFADCARERDVNDEDDDDVNDGGDKDDLRTAIVLAPWVQSHWASMASSDGNGSP